MSWFISGGAFCVYEVYKSSRRQPARLLQENGCGQAAYSTTFWKC